MPQIEHRVRHRDGSWHVVETLETNRLINPGEAGLVVNLRDVTERGQLEEVLLQA